jgi:hypothetical protein
VKGLPKKGKKFVEKFFEDFSGNYSEKVLNLYIHVYGENKGLEEFNKNYQLLYIKEYHKDFILPSPIKIESNMLVI